MASCLIAILLLPFYERFSYKLYLLYGAFHCFQVHQVHTSFNNKLFYSHLGVLRSLNLCNFDSNTPHDHVHVVCICIPVSKVIRKL